jgi:ABC-type branched-subunit amino acid transport system substrate-binding protein
MKIRVYTVPLPAVLVLLVLSTGLACLPGTCAADQFTPEEKRGKQIYLKTTSPSGKEIKAFVGKSLMEAPGAALPCVNCHGHDGVGLVESGVTATTISWEELTKAYGVKHPTGRERPAYREDTVARAITEGVDAAGNTLDAAMPRYAMSQDDLQDLIRYLKRLGTILDPGLSETLIRLGTILPARGRFAPMGQAMRGIMHAYFDELNQGGGIYNRKLQLVVADYPDNLNGTLATARQLLDEDIFAIFGAFIAGGDIEIADLVESEEVPLVGPLTLFTEDISALNRFTFYLFSGLREQMRALVVYARQQLVKPDPRVAVLYPEGEIPADIVAAIEEQCRKQGWNSLDKISFPAGGLDAALLVSPLGQKGTEAIFFLGSGEELQALLRAAESAHWNPYVFVSGSRVGEGILDVPMVFSHRVFLAYPTLPSDQRDAGMNELSQLLEKHKLPRVHLAAQISAYCAAKILVEGLKRVGRNLSREKLVASLEKLHDFDTGLTPRITYGPNRRIGALGAYIVTVDLEKRDFVPASKWITLE